MKEEAGVAETSDAFTKFVEVAGGETEGDSNLDAFAEIEAFERGLAGKLRMFFTEGADDAAKIFAKSGDRRVIANVEGSELLARASRLASASTHWAKSLEKPSVRK